MSAPIPSDLQQSDGYWAIHFEDAELDAEIFTSESHARARLAQLEINWHCHLLGPAERIAQLESSLTTTGTLLDRATANNDELNAKVARLEAELGEMREALASTKALLNTPEIEDFDKAVPLEAAHQVLRWGVEADAGKSPMDWFWLCGYLAGKALQASLAGNTEKAKHHCISTSAVMRNWHSHLRSGETLMRPGISEEKQSSVDTALAQKGETNARTTIPNV